MTENGLREKWLQDATSLLRPEFARCKFELPEKIRVSCGFPSRGALSKQKTLGECWDAETTVDGVHQIFISPLISDNLRVLDILVHELGHTLFPREVEHKLPFKKFCKTIGLEGPATTTTAGTELTKVLEGLSEKLGEYPHVRLVPEEKEAKAGTRMQKLVCKKNPDHPETDIVIRASKKVTALGIPKCFCSEEFIIEEEKKEDE